MVATTPRRRPPRSTGRSKVKLLGDAHQEAYDILEENRDVLDALVLALLDKETLDKAEVAEVFEALRKRPTRPAWTGSDERIPSSLPPVEIPQEVRDRAARRGARGGRGRRRHHPARLRRRHPRGPARRRRRP